MGDQDGLSEYEKKRLENIARNKRVLVSLGLATEEGEKSLSIKSEIPETKKRPRISEEDYDINPEPVRKCSRLQGVSVKTYHECDAELDDIERQEARRIKMSKRQGSMPKRFNHEEYQRAPRKNKQVKVEPTGATFEFKRLTHGEVMELAPTLAKDKTFNKLELKKLALFGFTPSHLQHANYPPQKIQVFTEFMQLVKQPDETIISPYQLRPYSPHQYTGMNGNPHVICPLCRGHVCLTEQGIPRKHDCL